MSSPEGTKNGKRFMDLDTILVEEVGQIGCFQYKVLAFVCIIVMFRAWSAYEYLFTAAKINSRCYIPGCDSETSEFLPEWAPSAIPTTSTGLDNCHRYTNTTQLPSNYTCPASLFDSSSIQNCESFVYQNTYTVAYEFDLACDEWRRSLIGSVRHVGMFLALPLTGYVSDRWGRKTALVMNGFNAAWLGIIRYWAKTYYVYLLSLFLETTLAGGVYTSAYVLAMEIMGPKYRVIGAAFVNSLFALGNVSLAVIAMSVPYWKHLTLALYAPQFLSLLGIIVLNESVRWTMSKGQYDEAESLIKKIAKDNKKSVSEKSLEELIQASKTQKLEEKESKRKSKWLLVEIVNNKNIMYRCGICAICWVANTFIYHGLTINATTISGNKYVNFAITSFIEIPGFWTGMYLLNKIGRKPVISVGFLICAIAQASYVFISKDMFVASLVLYMLSKFMSGMMLLAVYMYTNELYPTAQRHRFLALCSFMGRIGAVLAPLTPAFSASTFEEFPFVLFSGSALLSGILILFLPETLNTKLPDTMAEAENIGKSDKIVK